MGGKPRKNTPADKRLKANRPASPKAKSAPAKSAAPKFGSAAWDAKYGIKKRGK